MNVHKIILTFFIAACGLYTHAQTRHRDAGLWIGGSASYDINKRFSLDAELEMRTHQQFSRYHALLLDLGGGYKLNKHWRFGAAYRLGHRLRLDDRQDFRRRFNTDVKYRFKRGESTFDFRIRYQAGTNRTEERISDLREAVRFRVKMSHKVARRTYVGGTAEVFYGSRNDEFMMTDWRFRVFVERKLGKGRSITGGYIVQSEVNRRNPLLENVISLSYGFGLN